MTGVVNSVSSWLTISPPTMTTPSGWRSSLPTPVPSISGSALNSAASVVMRIGRKRSRQAWKIASSGGWCPSRSASSAKSIIMIAFFFTIPIKSTMAIRPITERSYPLQRRASSAPIPAEGSVERIVNGWIRLSYSTPSTI